VGTNKPRARTQLTIGGLIFLTKKAAEEHIRSLMKNYRDGDRLNLQDFNFVFDLLQRHPSSERKLGASGVAHFTIRHAPPWFRNRAF